MTTTDAITLPKPARMPSTRHLAWVAALALATVIPTFLVSLTVGEREDRASAVRADIVRAWGPEQRVAGPNLVVPITDKDGAVRYLAVAPRALDVHAVLAPSTRRRGLFSTTIYEATLTLAGTFELPSGFREGGPDKLKVSGNALVVVDVSGSQGLRDEDRADVAGAKAPWQSCADAIADGAGCGTGAGVLVADVDLSEAQGDTVPFSLTLHLRGSGALRIATAAKHAVTRIEGAWPTPSFIGTNLPSASTVTAGDFTATWTLDQVDRLRYLKRTSIAGMGAADPFVGIDLIDATPVYRTINRASKYELLIVALAFATYFLLEVVTGLRVALFQYAMLGASLSLFTLLLLSVSELAGYTLGYVASASLVGVQASLYTLSVTRRTRPTAVFAAMLATVFGFFYVLIGLESYSLVVGSVALFVVLSIVMGVTQMVTDADGKSPRTTGAGGVVLKVER